jgi:hypothetical protein
MTTSTRQEDAPAYWRRRAEEARRAAERMVDPISKKTLLDIASAYEELAASAAVKKGTGPSEL